MKWYYTLAGSHVHVRVFMNGGKCGDLCFRTEEFQKLIGERVNLETCVAKTNDDLTVSFYNDEK